jgi:hypothetical protein
MVPTLSQPLLVPHNHARLRTPWGTVAVVAAASTSASKVALSRRLSRRRLWHQAWHNQHYPPQTTRLCQRHNARSAAWVTHQSLHHDVEGRQAQSVLQVLLLALLRMFLLALLRMFLLALLRMFLLIHWRDTHTHTHTHTHTPTHTYTTHIHTHTLSFHSSVICIKIIIDVDKV